MIDIEINEKPQKQFLPRLTTSQIEAIKSKEKELDTAIKECLCAKVQEPDINGLVEELKKLPYANYETISKKESHAVNCHDCIHEAVCSHKSDLKDLCSKIETVVLSEYSDNFRVEIRCKYQRYGAGGYNGTKSI